MFPYPVIILVISFSSPLFSFFRLLFFSPLFPFFCSTRSFFFALIFSIRPFSVRGFFVFSVFFSFSFFGLTSFFPSLYVVFLHAGKDSFLMVFFCRTKH